MAKWGEGDPRWIVEERPDATNVNNWHWTEKNASPWSQEKIKELFKELQIHTELADFTIEEVEKCEGEASANNRKGKLIFFYEWNIVLKWKGAMKETPDEYHDGKIKIPNLSEEHDVSEVDIEVSVKQSTNESEKLKAVLHKFGKQHIREKLLQYITYLREEFSKGMILPKKDEIKPDNIKNLSSGFNKKINMTPVTNETNKQSGLKIETCTVKMTIKFQCRSQEFYDAMTKVEMLTAFTRSDVKIDAVKGGKFELFGGNIHGSFVELVPNKKIAQQWRYKQWPEGHFSIANIAIDEKRDHTEVTLIQTGVPKSEANVTEKNWELYYWESMKRTFGFGSYIQ